jgi:hypothetical protein
LTSVTSSGGVTTVTGTLQGVPNATYTLELFASSGGPRRGGRFLAAFPVTTDGSGLAGFELGVALGVAPGDFVTATATDPTGNTSPFSAAAQTSPAAFLDPKTRLLTVTGTEGDDIISLRRPHDGARLVVTVNGKKSVFKIHDVDEVRVDTRGGDDEVTLDVGGTDAPIARGVHVVTGTGCDTVVVRATATPTTVLSQGKAVVSVGDAGRLERIRAPLTVEGALGATTLNVDDSADTNDRSVTLSAGAGVGEVDGLAPGPIEYQQTALDALNVTGGAGNNTYLVENTGAGLLTTLNTGVGNDTVTLAASTGPLHIHGGAADPPAGPCAVAPLAWPLTSGVGTGSTTLVGPDVATTWRVVGAKAVTLSGPAFDQDVQADGIDRLRGGDAVNEFDPLVNYDGEINGDPRHANFLNYAGAPWDVVLVNLQKYSATGVKGGMEGAISGISHVRGASGPGTPGSSPYNVLIGDGVSTLEGGTGRPNLLIAGQTSADSPTVSELKGGDTGDILIDGTTTYDTASDWQEACMAIMREWVRTDLSPDTARAQKINHLSDPDSPGGLSGSYYLRVGVEVMLNVTRRSPITQVGGGALDWVVT